MRLAFYFHCTGCANLGKSQNFLCSEFSAHREREEELVGVEWIIQENSWEKGRERKGGRFFH
jgi:uncharacterized metal-binding protein